METDRHADGYSERPPKEHTDGSTARLADWGRPTVEVKEQMDWQADKVALYNKIFLMYVIIGLDKMCETTVV